MLLEKLATESSLAAVISTGFQSLSAEQVAQLQTQANTLLNKHLTLTTPLIDNYRQQLSSSTLIPLLNPLSTSKQELPRGPRGRPRPGRRRPGYDTPGKCRR